MPPGRPKVRKTENVSRMSAAATRDLVNLWLFDPEVVTNGDVVEYPEGVQRPRTRGECEGSARPCPFVSCTMHLYLDVSPKNGAIKINFPGVPVWEMPESCALDVAERYRDKGAPLAVLAKAMGLSYDRAFQVVDEVKRKVRGEVAKLLGDGDGEDATAVEEL
jgi:hypothetical protein